MRKGFLIVALVVAATVALFSWFKLQHQEAPAGQVDILESVRKTNPQASPGPTAELTAKGGRAKTPATSESAVIATPPAMPGTGSVAAPLRLPDPARPSGLPDFADPSPASVMENARAAFRDYRALFSGNPVGTNPEITAALNGGNPKQAKFIRETDGLRINEKGELVDPWGTPFFFHQLSAREMEIHCAGPDRVMWTADDLVIR